MGRKWSALGRVGAPQKALCFMRALTGYARRFVKIYGINRRSRTG